ncbi:MAG: hypothetical protein ACERKD_12380 [Prolixibacteraceae bacterium]
MKRKKITELQIQDLFTFCEENGVSHYELQIELVDHLANAIEQK